LIELHEDLLNNLYDGVVDSKQYLSQDFATDMTTLKMGIMRLREFRNELEYRAELDQVSNIEKKNSVSQKNLLYLSVYFISNHAYLKYLCFLVSILKWSISKR